MGHILERDTFSLKNRLHTQYTISKTKKQTYSALTQKTSSKFVIFTVAHEISSEKGRNEGMLGVVTL